MSKLACLVKFQLWKGLKKVYISTLNVMILQSIWQMDLKIDEQLDIQIIYKILQLELS